MKLIDKAALVAEIKRIEHETNYEPFTDEVFGERVVCKCLKEFLNTLEVKEVDLEKEVNVFIDNEMKFLSDEVGYDTLSTIARYFFELGLSVSNKAQKGKEV